MEDEAFEQLLESVNQADDIMKGRAVASKTNILDAMFETTEGLNDAGVMRDSKLNEFKVLCSEKVKKGSSN